MARDGWVLIGIVLCLTLVGSQVVAQTVIAKNVPGPALRDPVTPEATTDRDPASPVTDSVAVTEAEADSGVVALDMQWVTAADRTVLNLLMSRMVPVQVFTLANPYRIVMDLPEVEFRLSAAAERPGQGLVSAYRYGLFAAGRSRIVIDTTGPVRVVASRPLQAATHAVLQLQIAPVAALDFVPQAMPREVAVIKLKPALDILPPAPMRPASKGKFVVMIDPGHGGIDAGAMGGNQEIEKDIVLAVARQLKAILDARGIYDVRMTRNVDTFVGLDQRVAMSEAAHANLFVSLHADSVADPTLARTAHGATVYTLSEKASNDAARALADKENAADAAAGIARDDDADHGQVNTILADLALRETLSFSTQFQHLLLDRMRSANMLGRDPARAAAFRVLRQLQTPTVLIELGFISHQADAGQMQLADWQKRTAATIAGAIDSYAASRPSRK